MREITRDRTRTKTGKEGERGKRVGKEEGESEREVGKERGRAGERWRARVLELYASFLSDSFVDSFALPGTFEAVDCRLNKSTGLELLWIKG